MALKGAFNWDPIEGREAQASWAVEVNFSSLDLFQSTSKFVQNSSVIGTTRIKKLLYSSMIYY